MSEFVYRIAKSFRNSKSLIFYAFFLLLIISCAVTYFLLSDMEIYSKYSKYAISALYLNIAFILLLLLVGGNQLIELWKNRHNKGSHLTFRLISAFSLLAVIPSALMCVFSAIFFHNGIESWFNERNQTVLKESLKISETYLDEYMRGTLNANLSIARAVEYQLEKMYHKNYADIRRLPFQKLNNVLSELCDLKNMNAAILVDESLRVMAYSKHSVSLHFANISYKDVRALDNSKMKSKILSVKDGLIVAATCFPTVNGNMYLITEKITNMKIFEYANEAKTAYTNYLDLLAQRNVLELSFTFAFFAVGILLLLSSIFMATMYSWKIVKPISNLINVSEDIMRGDLTARTTEDASYEEIQILCKTFNEMIEKIYIQQKDMSRVNQELDEGIKFINGVLAGVSSGIIGIDNNSVYIWNAAAETLLGQNISFGEHIGNLLPQISDIFSEDNFNTLEKEIYVKRGNQMRLFSLRAEKVASDGEHRFVITFNDLTDIINTQKKAAWAEVARRVAHEVKNPLTPIQLAAERLQRKYKNLIAKNDEVFSELVQVIIRQVADIKRLIDSFSLFARLPDPQFKKCDMCELCKQAVFLMQNATNEVQISFKVDEQNTYEAKADETLIHQSIINLIKNSLNALTTVSESHKKISVTLAKDNGKISVSVNDNGPGFPADKIEQLATPYFTMMPKGTGLGLTIVQKIIQDHGGELTFKNNESGGASSCFYLPQWSESVIVTSDEISKFSESKKDL